MGQRHAVEESSHRQILRRWTARRGHLRNAPLSIAHKRNFEAKAKRRSAGQRRIVFPGLLEGASERTADSFGGGLRLGSARRRESASVAFGVLLPLRMGHDFEYVSATESSESVAERSVVWGLLERFGPWSFDAGAERNTSLRK